MEWTNGIPCFGYDRAFVLMNIFLSGVAYLRKERVNGGRHCKGLTVNFLKVIRNQANRKHCGHGMASCKQ